MTTATAGTTPLRTGTVAEFDERVGLGVVRGDDGSDVPFHSTAIADGTRAIEVGTRVAYTPVAAHRGATEAHPVTPLTP